MIEEPQLQEMECDNKTTIAEQKTEIIIPSFSYFKAPISNIRPYAEISVVEAYKVIKGNYFRKRTAELRSLTDAKEIRTYKALNFDYATFSGVFTRRSDASMIKHSGLLTLDFDHIDNVRELKQTLLDNSLFNTQLIFFSPSGTGLKWIVAIDIKKYTHLEWFNSLANYIKKNLDLEVDKSGKDVSRACFLCHDPEVYISKDYENEKTQSK